MLPIINGKSFLEIDENDLDILIDNSDYRENEYIDYKQNFAFLKLPNGKERDDKIAEFRSDVCSFANAEGGYLIYGISDEKGCAKEILGIEILNNNTDAFEQQRRHNLMSIYPKTPFLKFHFIELKNGKFIVVIFIKSDNFAPYLHLVEQKSYCAYSRNGNGKQYMTYNELKNKFNKSILLDKEIYNYRLDRINFYKNQKETVDKFLLIHFIPETFTDASYNINPFVLSRIKHIDFSEIFYYLCRADRSIPNVDGLRYIPSSDYYKNYECSVTHNGIVECFCPLVADDLLYRNKHEKIYFQWNEFWDRLSITLKKYLEIFKKLFECLRVFVCISIVNCKNVYAADEQPMEVLLDRDLIISNPVVLDDISKEEDYDLYSKRLYIEFLLSIGIRKDKKLLKLLDELYGNKKAES